MKDPKDIALRSLEESTLAGAALTEYFCHVCQEAVSLPPEALHQDHLDVRCEHCQAEIAVSLIYQDEDLEIHEFNGASFSPEKRIDMLLEKTLSGGPLNENNSAISEWIRAHADTEVRPEEPKDEEESFLDNYVSSWLVKAADGQEFEFKYFSVLREWISKGKLQGSDEVHVSNGEAKRLDEYPGTADLFGNPYLRGHVRFGSGNRRFPQPHREEKPATHFRPGLLLLAFTLTFLGPTIYFAFQWIQSGKGQAIHSFIQSKQPRLEKEDMGRYISEVSSSLRDPSPAKLVESEGYLRDMLALAPSNPDVLAGFISVWSELSGKVDKPGLLKQAKNLEHYALLVAPEDAALLESKARRLWRDGQTAEASIVLEALAKKERLSAEGKALLAQVSLDLGDYQTATVYLDAALEETGATEFYLRLFVDLLSRQGKAVEAASYLERVVALDASKEKDFLRLANLYEKAGDPDSALATLKKARLMGHDNAVNRVRTVEILNEKQDVESTVFEALEFLDLHPTHAEAKHVRSIYESALAQLSPSDEIEEATSRGRRSRSRRVPRIRRR